MKEIQKNSIAQISQSVFNYRERSWFLGYYARKFSAMLVIFASLGAFLMWTYQVVDDGELNLPNAPGNTRIVREKETGAELTKYIVDLG